MLTKAYYMERRQQQGGCPGRKLLKKKRSLFSFEKSEKLQAIYVRCEELAAEALCRSRVR
jgi:hypothetical protein